MSARYYDPELGRFISADSLVPDAGYPQAFDRYAYGYNNPISNADPTGNVPVAAALFSVMTLGGTAMAALAWSGRRAASPAT